MASKNNPDTVRWDRIVNCLQTIVLVITMGAAFMTIGESKKAIEYNTEFISELKDVTGDLVRAQVTGSVSDARHMEMLLDLQRRVDRLEQGIQQ
tara:strand:- start:116 stop:397 length:282 start_codon:yes stop_codon:yes gene_type:complete